jgi:HEPN domain-containing protein
MKLTAEHYHRAALERMGQAHALYRFRDSYALAMYAAGVAVECMLRAFKLLRDTTFDEKHDLRRLFRASGIVNIDPAKLVRSGLAHDEIDQYMRQLQLAVNDVCLLWANDYRFASERRLRSHLFRIFGERKRLKGDLLKAACLRLLASAQTFVQKGKVLWMLSQRN